MIARLMRFVLLLECCLALAMAWAVAPIIEAAWPLTRNGASWAPAAAMTLAILGGLLGVLVLRLLLSANNFFIAWRHRDTAHDLAHAAAAPTSLHAGAWLHMFFNEFAASMLTSSWTMPFKTFSRRLFHDSPCPPVLLIHGYGCNSGYWHSMSQALSSARISHLALDLEPVFTDIDAYVPQLQGAVEALCRETGQRRVIIVAHSMGGLVARAWMRCHGDGRLAIAITLGTPHHGTVLANLGHGVNARQMRRQRRTAGSQGAASGWLQQLHGTEQQGLRSRIVSLRSFHDNIVVPQSAAILHGADNLMLSGIGHVALGSHPAVQRWVVGTVRSMELIHPT
ncbi:MAG: esterase/lipase family protein [Janthinobacterium lividum]